MHQGNDLGNRCLINDRPGSPPSDLSSRTNVGLMLIRLGWLYNIWYKFLHTHFALMFIFVLNRKFKIGVIQRRRAGHIGCLCGFNGFSFQRKLSRSLLFYWGELIALRILCHPREKYSHISKDPVSKWTCLNLLVTVLFQMFKAFERWRGFRVSSNILHTKRKTEIL